MQRIDGHVPKPVGRVNRNNAEHYRWGGTEDGPCDGWHLVKRDGLSVIEELMPPGTAESRHRHAEARQFFYVLAGELTLELNGEVYSPLDGDGLEIGPGTTHQAINRSEADVRFLVVSQPSVRRLSGPADRIEEAGTEATR